jgi:hypothetical protein
MDRENHKTKNPKAKNPSQCDCHGTGDRLRGQAGTNGAVRNGNCDRPRFALRGLNVMTQAIVTTDGRPGGGEGLLLLS